MRITPAYDIDEIVAANILRLRTNEKANDGRRPRPDGEPWSRPALAQRLNELTGKNWTESRILDLEGRRKPRPPSPAKWAELVDLAIAFDVPIYDLVLPHDHQRTIGLGMPTRTEGRFELSGVHTVTTDEFAGMLFRLPSELLTDDNLAGAADRLNYEHRATEIDRQREAITWELADLVTKIQELAGTEETT